MVFRFEREDHPLRAEILSLDQLERHGAALANWHRLGPPSGRDRLLPRLAENERILRETCEFANAALKEGRGIVPAAEWLVDNLYVIESQVRLARQHLPRRYSRELPRLAGGHADSLPRVYDVAMELITHADGMLDAASLHQFVGGYQSVAPLKLGELWAIPIMLRLALLENLRRISVRIAWQQRDRDVASHWANQVLDALERDPKRVIAVLAQLIRDEPRITGAFVAEYAQRLQGRAGQAPVALQWLDHQLADSGQTAERQIHVNSQMQAADRVSMGNCVTSLRALGAFDWRDFVEEQSRVEQVLRTDPSGDYPRMSFATRDRYRHAVESIARRSRQSETQVARTAIELAQDFRRPDLGRGLPVHTADEEPTNHVGYYLVDRGRRSLERTVGYRRRPSEWVAQAAGRAPLANYVGAIVVIWSLAVGLIVVAAHRAGLFQQAPVAAWLPALVFAGIYAAEFAVSVTNWLCTLAVRPRPVPQLDFSGGIPSERRAVVVVPTMLTSLRGVETLVEQLEVRFLANRQESLAFALLTDFCDADRESLPQDAALVDRARAGIEDLNERYGQGGGDVFFLFHRPRRWNEREGVWMGRERKRGKLEDFNARLCGEASDAFSVVVGDVRALAGVRYVITLDTDTQLPRDTARELIGGMAHPLNRPRFNANGRVERGYAILQPRVAITVPDGIRTHYSRLFSGDVGIDPYTRQVSDVYQDVFGEGSFIGKGIYDVRAFEAALRDRFPENRILSHDLIESCYARSGLVGDVELFEGFPSRYLADASRRHRWVRGDWQLLAWLLPRVPGPAGNAANPLSLLSRWKLFDNLRRTLMPPVLLLGLIAAWILLPQWGRMWTAAILALVVVPPLLASLPGVIRKPDEMPLGLHVKARGRDAGRQVVRTLFALAVLPYEAHWNLDALVRTLYRLGVSRRRLLEWTTASDAERRADAGLRDHYELMYASTLVSLATGTTLFLAAPAAIPAAAGVLALWLAGPWLAWRISQPRRRRKALLSERDRIQLRRVARRTWRYFETFAAERENWLAPDNFQEHPAPIVATRTSPTNIGMGLIANLAAWDFGYVTGGALASRIDRTLTTMEQLERFRGHLFNWYDTRTLQPLLPRYVSSVDSGNLVGVLLVLRSGLDELGRRPILRPEWFAGLGDTLLVGREVLDASQHDTPATRELRRRIDLLLAECRAPQRLAAARRLLRQLSASAADLSPAVAALPDHGVGMWLRAFERQCRDCADELEHLAPWIAAPPPPDEDASLAEGVRERIEAIQGMIEALDRGCALKELPDRAEDIRAAIENLVVPVPAGHDGASPPASPLDGLAAVAGPPAWRGAWGEYAGHFDRGARNAAVRLHELRALGARCAAMTEMDFQFLYDSGRDLLAIGYNVTDHRRDNSYYDLLASEARLASYLAISQGQLPREHWFALGRMVTTHDGEPTLLSWSGSMFEYLMPMLLMPTYEETLLDLACRGAVARQIEHGRRQGIPWGASESCYNVTDASHAYQYRAFGVPGLGLKRGLSEDRVVAPYASAMAAMIAPRAACANLERIARSGWLGDYGFYDAIDFTPARLGPDREPAACRTYMAHHSGMTLLALAAALLDRPMQRRFLADPLLRSHDLLLQERTPAAIRPVYPHPAESRDSQLSAGNDTPLESAHRGFDTAETAFPEVHLLGNGQYHILVSNSGSGYSRWGSLAVTRWEADASSDRTGQFCYLRDSRTGDVWSTTPQPCATPPDRFHACFSHGKAEFRRLDGEIDCHTTIGVSSEDDVEVRRIELKNVGRTSRTLEATTYAEVVLAPPAADEAHRAFSNLFVTTELIPERRAILCTRRPRTPGEMPPVLFHLMVVDCPESGASFETDRSRFLGRGRGLRNPAALDTSGPLSNSAGAVLDPIVAIRSGVNVPADGSVRIDVVTGVAATHDAALALVERYRDHRLADRVFELGWTHDQVIRRQLGLTDADVQMFSRLAAPIVYGRRLDGTGPVPAPGRRNQSHLWAYGISGDLPIVLVKVSDANRLGLVRRLLQAHAYWRLKGLEADLVIWNDDVSGYRHQTHDALMGMAASGPDASLLDKRGGIFIRRSDQLAEDDRRLLERIACVTLSDSQGTLREQLERRPRRKAIVPALRGGRARRVESEREAVPARRDLIFANGLGGFTLDGKEYVITLRRGTATPAPWCNVLANEHFGTVVSESGLGYTWFRNAHECRLTPWRNDPVGDPCGEAVFVRDEETGRHFSATPLPTRGERTYVCRHGFGYSVWEYEEAGLRTELWTYVAVDAPAKFLVLRVRNTSGRKRSVSITGYVELTIGERRSQTAAHVVTEVDPQSGAILARNPFSIEFGEAVAYFQSSDPVRAVTCDRSEFLGRNGGIDDPRALRKMRLSGKAGSGLDPCAAIQNWFTLGDGEERETVFILGAAADVAAATGDLQRFRRAADARRALEKVWEFWGHTLSPVYVETPDPSVNVLANGWLLYQTLACRFWGRSGFYQSGGAYGFRDQLQDSLALVYSAGHLTRQHLVRCAGRQFREGDVQHWWHPPAGRGVRTHFSDDFLWLPFAVTRYVHVTGDTGVLDEAAPFLTDRPVADDEEGYYGHPQTTNERASLYEHCRRAIGRGLRFGAHGLPLMGCGDWNDGMNLVGSRGRGESVWLAFFLHNVLTTFAPLAHGRGDNSFAETCRQAAETLRDNIEQHAWDGEWYLRAWFDDGRPLGSSQNDECRIDALPQSWAAMTGAASPERTAMAMQAVMKNLVRPDLGIIQLFAPPFDRGTLEPGYIKGYLPGVRENGGQYTHAAIWTTMAFAAMGDAARAWECFELINPVNHSASGDATARYKVEPYVVAADVYSVSPHEGRGGWTWYTGSAGWMYRLIVESLLGLRLEGGTRLSFHPCVPESWKAFSINYRHGNTFYRIRFIVAGPNPRRVARVLLDGAEQPDGVLPLVDDRRPHEVEVRVDSISSERR